MAYCRNCSRHFADSFVHCPQCGEPLPDSGGSSQDSVISTGILGSIIRLVIYIFPLSCPWSMGHGACMEIFWSFNTGFNRG